MILLRSRFLPRQVAVLRHSRSFVLNGTLLLLAVDGIGILVCFRRTSTRTVQQKKRVLLIKQPVSGTRYDVLQVLVYTTSGEASGIELYKTPVVGR